MNATAPSPAQPHPPPTPPAPARTFSVPSRRLDWLDAAKGLAILLVVVGHTIAGTWRSAIYSFHMPLFFILSAMTCRWSADRRQFAARTGKAFRHLVVPALVMDLVLILVTTVKFWSWYSVPSRFFGMLGKKAVSLLFASGSALTVAGLPVESIGILWFFFALFIGRTLFDALHLLLPVRVLVPACLLLSAAGVLVSRFAWLPLSFDVDLAILPFFLFGAFVKIRDSGSPLRRAVLWTLLWAVAFFVPLHFGHGRLEISARIYRLYPLCFVPAVAGTMALSEACVWLVRVAGRWLAPLLFLGRNSLWFLFVHILDRRLFGSWWDHPGHMAATLRDRLLLNLLLFAAVMGLWSLLRKCLFRRPDPAPPPPDPEIRR